MRPWVPREGSARRGPVVRILDHDLCSDPSPRPPPDDPGRARSGIAPSAVYVSRGHASSFVTDHRTSPPPSRKDIMTKAKGNPTQERVDIANSMIACYHATEHFGALSAIAQMVAAELRNSDPKKARACAKMIRKIAEYNDDISYVRMNLLEPNLNNHHYGVNILESREDVAQCVTDLVGRRRKFNASIRKERAIINRMATALAGVAA